MKTYHRIESDELPGLVRFWQKALRLQDWDVIVRIVPKEKMQSPDNQGEADYGRANRQALIHILRPEDYDNVDFPQDMEAVLVHELMHLKLSWTDPFLKRHATEDVNLEVTVDSTAKALVAVARANPDVLYSCLQA